MINYEDKTIAAVETWSDGERYVHYYAYGYYAECSNKPPYRFLEYTFFIIPLKDVVDRGFYEIEGDESDQYKQYIEDCTEETMIQHYEHYDNGKMPKIMNADDLSMSTPDGTYIFL